MKETELFNPIQSYFKGLGYKINAEVKGFDIILTKGEEIIIIETKLNFNMQLLYQAINAQKVANFVYIAIPTPRYKAYKNIVHIVKALGIGFITIGEGSLVTIVIDRQNEQIPLIKKNYKKRKLIKKEVSERKFDKNIGGSTRVKLITATREKALKIAVCLSKVDDASPSFLVKQFNCPKNTGQILYNNAYGWFLRTKKGRYSLSLQGLEALKLDQYKDIIEYYRNI